VRRQRGEGKRKVRVLNYVVYNRMNWIVAIPSYKRPKELQKKTLSTLHDGKVPASRIYVFVVKEDFEDYKASLDSSFYNQIVVGELGLVNQRQFIQNHFPKDKLIVQIDDDIRQVVKKVSDTQLTEVKDICKLYDEAFSIMKKEGANIWGIYPSANPYYMGDSYTTNLRYLPGGMFGIKNTKNPAYKIRLGDNQEDKERTLRYYAEDKKIIRLNNISIKTTNYAPGGMSVNPNRKAETKERTEKLVEEFPDYITQIYKPAHKIYDIKFRTGKIMGGSAVRNIEGEDDVKIRYTEIRNREEYNKAKENLLEVLRRTTLPKISMGTYSRGSKLGNIGRTITFGFGDTRHGIKEYMTNQRYPELFKRLAEFGNRVVPKGWEYNGITLNEGMKAKKHKDSKNLGPSVIVGIGDFTGGGIKVWDANDENPRVLPLHDKPLMFNGGLLYHETQPFKGERYTMVFYRQMWEGQPKDVSLRGKGLWDELSGAYGMPNPYQTMDRAL